MSSADLPVGYAFFVCGIAAGPFYVYPSILDISRGPSGPFPSVFSVATFTDPRRVAVGICAVNPAQRALMDADIRMRTIDMPANWRHLRWDAAPAPARNAFKAFSETAGIDVTRVTNSESLPAVMDILSQTLKPGRTLEELVAHMARDFGLIV